MFGLQTLSTWSFLAFSLVLLQPVLLFLLAALILPDSRAESVRDLRANYYAHSRWFFGLAVLLLLVSLTRDLVLTGGFPGRSTRQGTSCFWSAGALAPSHLESHIIDGWLCTRL
jgi:hypothetical protein